MTNNGSLGFGIIGCGRIANKHAQAISESGEGHIVSFADIDVSKASLLSRRYGGETYESHLYLLSDKRVNVVSICTPSYLHYPIAIDAIKAGKHVIIEKPIAMKMEDAKDLVNESNKRNTKISVVLQNRYNLSLQTLKKAISENALGAIHLVNATVRWYRPQGYYEDDWHGRMEMEGGVVLNQAIHCLDAIEWLAGPVSSVYAEMDVLSHNIEAPDSLVATLRLNNGGLGTIEASTIAYPENHEASITLIGEKGMVKVGGLALDKIETWKVPLPLDKITSDQTPLNGNSNNIYGLGHRMVIQDMIDAIKWDREPKTSAIEGIKSLRLALAIIKSAYDGICISLK